MIGGFKVQGLGRVLFVVGAKHTGQAEDAFASRFGINEATMFRACQVDWVEDVHNSEVQSNNIYGLRPVSKNPWATGTVDVVVLSE